MQAVKEIGRVESVLRHLPSGVRSEILRRAMARVGGTSSIREIRLRLGVSSVLFSREWVGLVTRCEREELSDTLESLTGGAVYAERDSMARGYISLPHGVRVGISGRARYDGERLVGVSEVGSLVFRIPTGECEFGEELYSVFSSGIGRGMLIYSPPGVGKTTALRYLAKRISVRKSHTRIAVIDERCEFSGEDFRDTPVELLSGYEKGLGMEIAIRTLSPAVIMVDELSATDAAAVMSVLRSGVPLIATAHATDLSDLKCRAGLSELIGSGAFSVFVGISYGAGGYLLSVEREDVVF